MFFIGVPGTLAILKNEDRLSCVAATSCSPPFSTRNRNTICCVLCCEGRRTPNLSPPTKLLGLHNSPTYQKEVTMVPIPSLWLPILLSAVFVFIASSLVHMVFRYHSNDLKKLPDEEATVDAIRKLNIPEGQYIIPHAGSMQAMNSPEFQEKVKKGPRAILTIWPGGNPSMAPYLIQWFIYSVVVGIFAAYVAGRALEVGAHYLAVFRFVGVTAFTCYAIANWQESIWYKRAWSVTMKNTLDGLFYALLTAGTFGWLLPR